MCFRPADASASGTKCPECGKAVQMMGGLALKACPFCKANWTPYFDGSKPIKYRGYRYENQIRVSTLDQTRLLTEEQS